MPDAYSYYEDLLKRAGDNPDKYENSVPGIEQLGDRIYNQTQVSQTQIEDFIPEAKKIAEEEVFESRENAKLYGFVPGKWLPDWVKEGYNNSIEGLGYQMATGQRFFDVSEDYQKNKGFAEDVGEAVTSFFTLTDMGTLIGGGGLAGAVANLGYKKAAKETIKGLIKQNVVKGMSREAAEKAAEKTVTQLVQKNKLKATQVLMQSGSQKGIGGGITKELATEIVEAGAGKLPNKIMASGIGGAGGMGLYGGLQSAFGQKIQTGDIDALLVTKDVAVNAGLGAFTASSGTMFGKYLSTKLGAPVTKTQKIAQTTAVKALETAQFGTATPLIEGRAPEWKDYAHAAGVIAGMNVAKRIPSTAKRLAGFDNPKLGMKSAAEAMAEGVSAQQAKDVVWTSKRGASLINVQFKEGDKGNNIVTGQKIDLRTNRISKETIQLTEKQFTNRGFARDRAGKSKDVLRKSRRQEIFGRKKQLNISDKEFRRIVEGETGKILDPKKNKTGFSQLSPIQQIRVLDLLRKRQTQKDIYSDFKKQGYDEFFIPKRVITSKLVPEFLMQTKNRYNTVTGLKIANDINAADARGITLAGTYIYKLKDAGLYSGNLLERKLGRIEVEVPSADYKIGNKAPTKRGDKYYIKIRNEKQAKEYFEDLGFRLGEKAYQSDADVVKFRKILVGIYKDAKKAGIPVRAFRENYFPNQLKEKYLKFLGSDIFKIIEKDPKFEASKINRKDYIVRYIDEILGSSKLDKRTVEAFDHITKNLIKEAKENGYTLSDRAAKADAFLKIRDSIYKQRYSLSGNLVKSRGAKFPEEFYERDARLVLTKYANDVAKDIANTEFFGAKNQKINIALAELRGLSDKAGNQNNKRAQETIEKEIAWVNQTFNSYNNMIEVDPTKNWKDPRARNFWRATTDFEVATKIGLGYATVPNVTQTFISTAVKAGYYNTFKGTYKLATDKKYREMVSKSGLSNLSVFQMISGLEPADTVFGRAAHTITKYSGFQGMNKVNQYVAAAAGNEYIKNLVDVANGRGTGLSRLKSKSWAQDNLRQLGLSENIKNLSERQSLEAMYRFSRDAQLQRNVLNDPMIFNDPRFRPFFLFKRFGYKQYNWIRENVGREVFVHGNVLPLLRLGIGGFFGAQFVVASKKALNNFLAGDEGVFDENQLFVPDFILPKGIQYESLGSDVNMDLSDYKWSDFLDDVSAVGAMGFIGDILANEDKARALEFLIKPAILQDALKGVDAAQRMYKDIQDFGIGIKTGQRSLKYIAPILGTAPRRFLQRFETEGQKETYIKYRRGIVKGRMLDALIDGNEAEALKIMKAWNNAYPEQYFTSDDMDGNAIYDRIIKKEEKKLKP
jgi:hypothetical protein